MAFAYSQMSAHEERTDMIAYYQLTEGEDAAYDSCQSALSDKELKNGGSKAEFCGCFAKKATTKLNVAHKAAAGRVLNLIADQRTDELESALPAESYAGVADSEMEVHFSILEAFTSCNDEVTASCSSDDSDCNARIQTRMEKRAEFEERKAHLENSKPEDAPTAE